MCLTFAVVHPYILGGLFISRIKLPSWFSEAIVEIYVLTVVTANTPSTLLLFYASASSTILWATKYTSLNLLFDANEVTLKNSIFYMLHIILK